MDTMPVPASSPSFGELLRRHRRAAGFTQEALAERAGMSRRGIDDLERAVRRAPRKGTVALLVDALALTGPARAAFEEAALRRPSVDRSRSLPGVAPAAVDRHVDYLAAGSLSTFGSRTPALWPPLVGRAAEVARLDRHLGGVGPPLLVLAGEPGIGKSRLLGEAVARAQPAGWTIVAGGCQRRNGQDPYAPFESALSASLSQLTAAERRAALHGCAWLVRLLPELVESAVTPTPDWAVSSAQERRLVFAAVSRYLTNVAGPAGTLLVLDDLQWAGPDALDLLAALPWAEAAAPLRFLGAYRSTEIRPADAFAVALGDLAREGLAAEMALGPLEPSAAASLVASLVGEVADQRERAAVVERVVQRTGGIPYFVVTCAEVLRRQPMALAGDDADLPWTARQSIRQRVAALPEAARDLLGLAALAGRTVTRRVLADAAFGQVQDRAVLLSAIEATCQAGLLSEVGTASYQFAHDLVRETVMADLSTARRAAGHLALALALERQPEQEQTERAAELAWHFAQAEEPERAIPYALAAGERAARAYAHEEAERYFRTARELAEATGDQAREAEALEKQGAALQMRARYDQSLEVLARAAVVARTRGDLEGEAGLIARMASVHALRSSPREGLALLDDALARLGTPALSEARQAALYLARANLFNAGGRYEAQLAAAERAGDLARSAGDRVVLARAEYRRGNALLVLGRDAEGRRVLEAALPLIEASGDLATLAHALNNLAVAHEHDDGDFATARDYLERVVAAAERSGDPVLQTFAAYRRGINALATGAWTLARADLERAGALARAGGPSWASPYALIGLGRLCLAQGMRAEAEMYLNEALILAQHADNLQSELVASLQLAEGELLDDDAEAAFRRLSEMLGRMEGRIEVIILLPALARAQLRRGEIEEATALITRAAAALAAYDRHLIWPDVLRARALVAMERARRARDVDGAVVAAVKGSVSDGAGTTPVPRATDYWREAARDLANALRRSRAIRDAHTEVKLGYTYGLLLAERGERTRARERLEAALALCARLGEGLYRPQIERALAELAALP